MSTAHNSQCAHSRQRDHEHLISRALWRVYRELPQLGDEPQRITATSQIFASFALLTQLESHNNSLHARLYFEAIRAVAAAETLRNGIGIFEI